MAAPAEKTVRDLSGKWVMNKTLSDDTDSILAMQGVGWLTRRAIGLATITLWAKQYVDEEGSTHVDIDQTLTGGIKGTTELRTLDWTMREHTDNIFGSVQGRSRFVKFADLDGEDRDFLGGNWSDDAETIQSIATSDANGWTAVQTWGFETIEDTRRYARHVVVRKGTEVKTARLFYDYAGEI